MVCPYTCERSLDMELVLHMCLSHLALPSHVWVVMSWHERFTHWVKVRLLGVFGLCVGWMGHFTHTDLPMTLVLKVKWLAQTRHWGNPTKDSNLGYFSNLNTKWAVTFHTNTVTGLVSAHYHSIVPSCIGIRGCTGMSLCKFIHFIESKISESE